MNRDEIRELREVLARARVEKLSQPTHTKLPFSVANWLQQHVGKHHISEFVRESIVQRLERMADNERF